jgi:hypothetical protein
VRPTKTFVAVLGAMVAMGAAVAADAATTHYATTVDSTGTSSGSGDQFIEYGRVHSPKPACRSERSLRMVAHYPDGSTKVLDTTTSSRNGAYAMFADFKGSDGAVIKVAPKRLGTKANPKVCNRASVPAD